MSVTHLITYIVPNRVVGPGQVSAEYPSWVTKPIGVTKPSSWVDPHLNSPLEYYNYIMSAYKDEPSYKKGVTPITLIPQSCILLLLHSHFPYKV